MSKSVNDRNADGADHHASVFASKVSNRSSLDLSVAPREAC